MYFFKVFTQLVLLFVGYHILWVQLAAQGIMGKRVDEMELGFIMVLDYMIELAEKDQGEKVLFQVIFSFFSIDMDYSEPIFSCIVVIITTFMGDRKLKRECFLEKKEEMGDNSLVLKAVLKETVDWVIDLDILKHFILVCYLCLFVKNSSF